MARPTTKTALLEAAQEGFDGLERLLDAMSDEEREATFELEDRDRNVRDVLIHLTAWHRLLVDWMRANLADERRPFFPAPYTWKTYGDMNVEIWRAHQDVPLGDARRALRASHAQALRSIEELDDAQLFERQHFDWTGTTTVGSYCVSATSAHYAWAAKKLRRHRRAFAAASH
ncbi:ClbS/DfsB family four-helix bundle protein [Demequina pelophila]|uniref:ClbS/DfsB family four-helix bundle protein n=1 Tax=Demequina pelophila TaxID=1638984 RepID=UPI0007824102|nr:ClbS/DfsB family four-helix bundle protein [Demequina pelophila]